MTYTLTTTTTTHYSEGWGVAVEPIFDEETDRVSNIEVAVVRLDRDHAHLIGGAWCVDVGGGAWYPIDNFEQVSDLTEDDTHDLRSRWFATEQEAQDHADYTSKRWANPQPWESFVKV